MAAILTGNAQLLGAALDSDVIVEPVRGPLIPGMMEVKAAAKAAGGWCWWGWRWGWSSMMGVRVAAKTAGGEQLQRGSGSVC